MRGRSAEWGAPGSGEAPFQSTKKKLLELHRREKLEKRRRRKVIFFVVHGLEANPFDMRHIRAAILANVANASVHLVQKNFGLTNESIARQGRRFADEVLEIFKFKEISGGLTRKHRVRLRGALARRAGHPRGRAAPAAAPRQDAALPEPELAAPGLLGLEVPGEDGWAHQA